MSGSTPYFLFGAQRRYPYAWHGGAGGVPQGNRAAETRSLGLSGVIGQCFGTSCFGAQGSADLVESGLDPYFMPYSAFKHTHLHDPTILSLSDWPLLRPAGVEPLDPHGEGLGLSDNEKTLGAVIAVGAVGWLLWKKSGRAGGRGSRRLARRTRRFMRR